MTSADDGPDIVELMRERDAARAHARAVEHEMGELRGKIKRLERALWRQTARRRRLAAFWLRIRGASRS